MRQDPYFLPVMRSILAGDTKDFGTLCRVCRQFTPTVPDVLEQATVLCEKLAELGLISLNRGEEKLCDRHQIHLTQKGRSLMALLGKRPRNTTVVRNSSGVRLSFISDSAEYWISIDYHRKPIRGRPYKEYCEETPQRDAIVRRLPGSLGSGKRR